MTSLDDLKSKIDLHTLARLLGMRRASGSAQGNASYHSPLREDKHPSVSFYTRDGQQRWKDHGTGEGGSCIDLVIYAGKAENVSAACHWLRHAFNLPAPAASDDPSSNYRLPSSISSISSISSMSSMSSMSPMSPMLPMKSRASWIAERCLQQPQEAITYLADERSISRTVAEQACQQGTLGYSCYTGTVPAGQVFHGGPAAAFICRDTDTRQVTAVEYRYFDPELNGNVKNHCHGAKGPAFWSLNPARLHRSNTVVLVESPINALSIETTREAYPELQNWTALAIMGATNLQDKNWSILRGKRVLLAMDNDQPNAQGRCPGAEASWSIHEQLLALNITCQLLDFRHWEDINDLNDLLQTQGTAGVRQALFKTEPWLISGLSGSRQKGRARLWLPEHDYSRYSQFRVREDFTSYQRMSDRNGESQPLLEDLCGFRIAALSRIRIQSAAATLSGSTDIQPTVVFSASLQTARHGTRLIRQVITDEQLYNLERWRSIGGAIYKAAHFNRMLNILERATGIGSRDAINFVGLAWRQGQAVVNQGPDCYFTEPDKQCPYHNLRFPSGHHTDAARIIHAFQQTFSNSAATLLLVWSLGAHLKTLLGFWPHMIVQADKGAGKSTLIKRLETLIGFTMFSGQSLHTEFRLVTSVSHTSHPVGWEELSARRTDIIDRAVALLQETYQYTITRRGPELTEYVLSAPVLLAGEDVPVQSLQGKVVRTELTRKGPLLPDNLPCFPVRQWLDFLTQQDPATLKSLYNKQLAFCRSHCAAPPDDNGTARVLSNYAALATSWQLLCEFSSIPLQQYPLPQDLLQTMNNHLLETGNSREPWVWIMEIILGELDAGQYLRPYRYEQHGDDYLLFIRTPHIMQHLSQSPALRSKYDALPVKSDRILKKQLIKAGVLTRENDDRERRINGQRCAHMSGLSLNKLESFGLSPLLPDDSGHTQTYYTPE